MELSEKGKNPVRKKKRKFIIAFFLAAVLIWSLVGVWISYNWIQVNIYTAELGCGETPLRLVVISDLHDHEFGGDNEPLVEKIRDQEPQLILLDGDLLNEDSLDDHVPVELVQKLKEIAPVYYALGNHEITWIKSREGAAENADIYQSELVQDLTEAGAVVLEERYENVDIGGTKLRIGGMYGYAFALDGENSAAGLAGSGREFLEEFQDTDRCRILLCHRPDSLVFGDAADYWGIDLAISGHDHGGQVVLPFLGGLYGGDQGWFPPYVHGMHEIGKIQMFVTSGLGSERQLLPRWNNRPEIAVIDIK